MTAAPWHYDRRQLVDALRAAGIARGDIVSLQVSLGRLGYAREGRTEEAASANLVAAFREVLGPEGTLLVPTYTYSIGRLELFDVDHTPSRIGFFTEYFRQLPGVIRSADPMLSTCGFGPRAGELLTGLSRSCYGNGSTFHALRLAGGKLCTIGISLYYTTFLHHIEATAEVPFRFTKLFHGYVREGGKTRHESWEYYAAPFVRNCQSNPLVMERLAREAGLVAVAPVGRGEVMCVAAQTYFDFGLAQLQRDSWLTAKGPACTPDELVALEDQRVGVEPLSVHLPGHATAEQMIGALAPLRRDLVSDGFDAALAALATQLPMQIHTFHTGTPCLTWVVPEKWTCREAWLETMAGDRLISYAECPLHVASYSQSFAGVVSREELLRHLTVHPVLPDRTPFDCLYDKRDWRLCCPRVLRDAMTDPEYRVKIDAAFSFGALKVGEVVIPGESPEAIVFCAHLDHPAQVNDGVLGVVGFVEVMRAIAALPKRRYTYRLLILSETIGSVAWLSRFDHLVPTLQGGLSMAMIGLDHPLMLQLPYRRGTLFEACCLMACQEVEPQTRIGNFLEVVTGDERQFNSPAYRVPMLSLSRVAQPCGREGAQLYPAHHSDADDGAAVHPERYRQAVTVVLRIVAIWERNVVPKPLFKGEACLSRHGIVPDHEVDPQYGQALLEVMHAMDGRTSLVELAQSTNRSFDTVADIVGQFHRAGLVELL